jgi:hypothetical protein
MSEETHQITQQTTNKTVHEKVNKTIFCPSGRPEWENSIIFGIIGGNETEARVIYLDESIPITSELLEKAAPVTPAEIYRVAVPCAHHKCLHFDGANCTLAQRVVEKMAVVEEELPKCSIRENCRWWHQEGKTACMRCPQVVTDNYNHSEFLLEVAIGNSVNHKVF